MTRIPPASSLPGPYATQVGAFRLLALHGMTLNGAVMKRQMGQLRVRLEQLVATEWLDAPHPCPALSVQRHYARWGMPIPDGPHLRWWDASSDGSVYDGWPQTRELLKARLGAGAPTILLGFSQGAAVAAAVAALSAQGELPPILGVILVAGMAPRADDITRHVRNPIDVPSLHVWGQNDPITGAASERLSEWFVAERRHVHVWQGAHSIPRRGPPAEVILSFVRALTFR